MAGPEFATLTSDDLVTGEAVALDLPPAGVGVRLLSGLIDVVITIVALIVVAIVFGFVSINTDPALAQALVIAVSILVLVVVPTTIDTLTRGRSVGRLALGLRVVRDDAGPVSFQHVLIRHLVGVVEIYGFLGAPAFFSMILSGRGRRLGDYAAGTYVVRERVVLRLPMPVPMPPHLGAWARRADMTSLPTGLALAVRQYLGRLPTLHPAARAEVGHRLALEVGHHVAPAPPEGTTPEAFLAAVIAERRERDLRRLRRQDHTRRRLVARR